MDYYVERLFSGTYYPGTVLINCSTEHSDTTITLAMSGVYKIEIVGGGAGGCWITNGNTNTTFYSCGGGSGAAYIADVYIKAGTYHWRVGGGGTGDHNGTYTVGGTKTHSGGGGGNTAFGGDLFVAKGASSCSVTSTYSYGVYNITHTASQGGEISISNSVVEVNRTLKTNGNAGGSGTVIKWGGDSKYPDKTYGQGGSGCASGDNPNYRANGSAGFLKLTYLRPNI